MNNAERSKRFPDAFADLLASRSIGIRQQQDKFLAAISRSQIGRPPDLRRKNTRKSCARISAIRANIEDDAKRAPGFPQIIPANFNLASVSSGQY